MPSPVTPDNFKALIPGTSSSLCDKFTAFLQMPFLLWQKVSYERNEDGSLTDAFKAEICAAFCLCGGGVGSAPNPNMPAPTGVGATNGGSDVRIEVTWLPVTPPTGILAVTRYFIYRAPATINNPNDSTLVGTVTSPTVLFDDPVDGDLSIGTLYNYWVRATNEVDTSGYSAVAVGKASFATTTLTAVSDLACTKGFYKDSDGFVGLVWTPTGGASKWDIYRNTVNDAGTAVLIASDQTPISTGIFGSPPDNFWDNDGELLYEDDPPMATAVYYYWVVGKKDSPPAVSPKSNVDSGWLAAGLTLYGNALKLGRNEELTIPGGTTSLRFVVFGGGAAGAGGGIVYGAGGGGGGGIAIGEVVVTPGGKLRVTSAPNTDTNGNAAAQTNGAAGYVVKLQYSADGLYDDTIDLVTTVAPGGGVYSGSGGGSGGGGGGAAVHGSVTNSSIISGRAGGAGNGGNGGKSGYLFGSRRLPMSNRLGPASPTNGVVGSGSKNAGSAPSLEDYKGGSGSTGWAVIAY